MNQPFDSQRFKQSREGRGIVGLRAEYGRHPGRARYLFSLLLGLLMLGKLYGTDRYEVVVRPVEGEIAGVLVLCPGMNGDGSHFLREEPWTSFADSHRLGMVALRFSSDPDGMYGPERLGYYWPEQGSGEALLRAVEEHFGPEQPLLLYGFSGGAQFVSRFVEWVPERVKVWAAYSAQFWDSPKASAVSPPGIVACGDWDGGRWFPSYAYFYEGRELGKPWTWVSLGETGHVRRGAFESFVRDYFETIFTASGERAAPVWVDVGTFELLGPEEVMIQPGLAAVLPDVTLLQGWRDIHVP